MKKPLLILFSVLCTYPALIYSQGMVVKKHNFTTFTTTHKLTPDELQKQSSAKAKQHPEYGYLPYNAHCRECVEIIDKRTADSRFYVDPIYPERIFTQKSYTPLHYRLSENDVWRTIDYRLKPEAGNPNVYSAKAQHVPTKCDMNRKSTFIGNEKFEFEYNRNLLMYFFDENSVYTKAELSNYSNYTVGEEGLHVKDIFSGIDMQQIYREAGVKTNYIISKPLQLPSNKGYLVIEDHFSLPEGFTLEEAPDGKHKGKYYQGDYIIKDKEGYEYINYGVPVYHDARVLGQHGLYELIRSGNDYTLRMLVPADWLNRADNVYPLTLDPLTTGVTYGNGKLGYFRSAGNPAMANLGFTSKDSGSCNYSLRVNVPAKTTITNSYVDLEYQLTYDNMCGNPPLPAPFCTFSQVTMEVKSVQCNTTTGKLSCNPAQPPFTGTCTTDSNLVPNARAINITNFVPNYLACITPHCGINYELDFTLSNQDSICGDSCGYLCARGNIWQMTIEACQINGGTVTQDKTSVCAGEPVTFTANANCGVPPYHYVWLYENGNTVDTIYGTNKLILYPEVTDNNITYMAVDTCDIFDNAKNSLSVTVKPSPPADAGPDVSTCTGTSIAIGGNPTSNGTATVQWTGLSAGTQGWISSGSNYNPNINIPQDTIGAYRFVVRAVESNCFRTDTVTVTSLAPPDVSPGPDAYLCAGGVANLGGSPTSTAPGATYVWSGDAATTPWINNPTAANPQANIPVGVVDTFNYTVEVSVGSCKSTGSLTVFSRPSPIAMAGNDTFVCESGGTVQIGGNPAATPGATIAWTGDAATQSWISDATTGNPTVTVPPGSVGSFNFVIRASDTTSCFRTDTVTVLANANPLAVIDTSGSTIICGDKTVTLTVRGNYPSYLWSDGSTGKSITVSQSGQYTVTVADQFGCVGISNPITVTAITVPSVTVFPDTTIMYGDTTILYTDLDLTAPGIDSFAWYPPISISCLNCPNPAVSPPYDLAYGVQVYASGCAVTDTALIKVLILRNFFIPNIFTPNGDGNNETFYIFAQSAVKVFTFQVFNRLGEKVHDGLYPWDGNYKGKPCQPGVYIYQTRIGLVGDDQGLLKKGSITLVR